MLSTSSFGSIDPLKQVIFSVPKFQPLSQELYLIIPVLLSRPHRAQSHLWVKPELESSFRDPEEKSPAQGRDLETGRINLSLGSLQTLDQVIDGPVEGEGKEDTARWKPCPALTDNAQTRSSSTSGSEGRSPLPARLHHCQPVPRT